MFGLFKQKAHTPSVTTDDKDWIEKNILWFIQVFGLRHLKQGPFLLPSKDSFPYDNLKDPDQFHRLFEQLCGYWAIDAGEVNVKFFDDIRSKQWEVLVPQGSSTQPAGLYYRSYEKNEKRFNIHLAKSNLNHPELLVAVIAHELAHVKLLGSDFIKQNDPDMEPLTDLASIFFGFGIFVANACQTKDINWISRFGYLANELISYTNALLCYITNTDIKNLVPVFNTNTKALFKQDHAFLVTTGDTILTKETVCESAARYETDIQINEGFANKDFDRVIAGCKKLLVLEPRNQAVYNNLGYALLYQKKYEEAIEEFTKAIEIEPFWDYPYNNRGYCKLQTGAMEDAFVDIHSSFEMNPDNSFSWRNMGAYYLAVKELEKALEHFDSAERLDPKTELLNFYFGHTYLEMGNEEKATYYFDKSKEAGEYNYSAIG